MKYIGAHVAVDKGVSSAPVNAHAIGAKAFSFLPEIRRDGSRRLYPPLRPRSSGCGARSLDTLPNIFFPTIAFLLIWVVGYR